MAQRRPLRRLAQFAGAFLAAATLFLLFNPYLKAREQEKHVVRGAPGSEITAMCYGEYFPSPGPLSNAEGPYSIDAHQRLNALVSEPTAFLAEFLGTLVLAMVVFAVTDERNPGAPPVGLAPVFIGLTVSALDLGHRPADPGVLQPGTGLRTQAVCVPCRLGTDRPAGHAGHGIPHRLHHRPHPGVDHGLWSLHPRHPHLKAVT